jgi:hypothetical protein
MTFMWVCLGVPLAMYLSQGWGFYFPRGRIGMAIAMTGYALGNVGLIIDAYERGGEA